MTRAKDISKIVTDANLSGTLDVTGETTLTTHLNMGDNDIIKLGASTDLQIYHDGSNSYISDTGTGNLRIRGTNLHLQDSSGYDYIVMADAGTGGTVDLKYNASSRLTTTSAGIDVTGEVQADSLDIDGNGAIDGTLTITTADNEPQLILTSTDADGNEGPVLKLLRNSASPADDDNGGRVQFTGKNDAGQDVEYGRVRFNIQDATDGTEDGQMDIATMINGSLQNRVYINDTGVVINDGSIDSDFRVESNNSTNALFVDGANGHIGIGTSSPSFPLHLITSTDGSGLSGDDIFIAHFHNQEASDSRSFGLLVSAGSTVNDQAFAVREHTGNTNMLVVKGNGEVHLKGNQHDEVNVKDTLVVNCSTDTSSNDFGIFINGNLASGSHTSIRFHNNQHGITGSISHSSVNSTQYNTSSDYRLKENVTYDFDATTRLKQLKPARFNFIADADTTVDGFLAHEVSSVVPEAITGEKDATETYTDDDGNEQTRIVPQGIDQSKLVPLLVKTIQELEARITALESA